MFKIYNCLGEQVGNPKGYRTIKGAERMLSRRVQGNVHDTLWDAYKKASEDGNYPHLVVAIKWEGK